MTQARGTSGARETPALTQARRRARTRPGVSRKPRRGALGTTGRETEAAPVRTCKVNGDKRTRVTKRRERALGAGPPAFTERRRRTPCSFKDVSHRATEPFQGWRARLCLLTCDERRSGEEFNYESHTAVAADSKSIPWRQDGDENKTDTDVNGREILFQHGSCQQV